MTIETAEPICMTIIPANYPHTPTKPAPFPDADAGTLWDTDPEKASHIEK